MSQSLVPQVDVGNLTLRGLSAFTPLLAALTADNVAPMTMIQLESLGALYHINGPYAAKVPDLLRRCSSVQLDQMAVSIGWRKGDTASVMANSSAGQAIALMCLCLENICARDGVGPVLYDLSEAVLARSMSVHSSISQLTEGARVLSEKLQAIGFGNILAEQAVKIHDAYAQLGLPLPRDFFDFMTREAMVELFRALSAMFEDEDTIIRISGIHTMGHIVTLMLVLFPDNVMLVIEGLLVREGPRPSIILEITSSPENSLLTTMHIEKKFGDSLGNPIHLDFVPATDIFPYKFKWSGHIADALEVAFASAGLRCSEELREACCDLLYSSITPIKPSPARIAAINDWPFPLSGFVGLLGLDTEHRITRICGETFRTRLPKLVEDLRAAFANVLDAFKANLGSQNSCSCDSVDKCDVSQGWRIAMRPARARSAKSCLFRRLWRAIGSAIERGYFCLLIDAQPNSTTKFDIYLLPEHRNIGLNHLYQLFGWGTSNRIDWGMIVHECIMRSVGIPPLAVIDTLALSGGGSTVLGASLLDLQFDIDQGYRYKLFDGQLMIKGRYRQRLTAMSCPLRERSSKSMKTHKGAVRPSSIGEHSRISFSIKEHSQDIEMRTTILVQGHSIHINLHHVMMASMGVNDAPACDHDLSDTLEPMLKDEVLSTSIANFQTKDKNKIAIVQTMGNPTAQMLASDKGTRSVLQRHCCLNCAVQYAKTINARQIIVATY